MICTNYYYSTRLERQEYRVREVNGIPRFYPGKSFEIFPVWFEYVRKHYPDEHIYIIDNASPISIEEGLALVSEPYEKLGESIYTYSKDVKIHVKTFTEQLDYLHAVSRNVVEGLTFAYRNNEPMFWLDTDHLLDTDMRPSFAGYDVVSTEIMHDQMTMGMVCLYLSAQRLHQWDKCFSLPEALATLLKTSTYNTRMHTFFEGGLYKLFCYGKFLQNNNINGTHMSCYDHLLNFLLKHPLSSPHYHKLVALMKSVDFGKLHGASMSFDDINYQAK